MKILLSAFECDPTRGSEAGNGWNWAWNLASQGHEVCVVTRSRDTLDVQLTEIGKPLNLRFVQVPISTKAQKLPRLLGVYAGYLTWQRAAYRRAQEIRTEFPFEIVHHVTWGSLVWGSPLWRLPVPFVFGPLGGGQTTPKGYRRFFFGYWWMEVIRNFVVKRVIPINPLSRRPVRKAHLVLAINTDTIRLVSRLGAQRTQLVIDTAAPASYEGSGDPKSLRAGETLKLVWVGRLLPRKGLPLALEALAEVRTLPWHLTIVGDGTFGQRIAGWLEQMRIEDRVEWVGQVEWGEVKAMYQRAHVMLFTSLRDSAGNQLYEAAACGLPVIALNHHGIPDMLPDTATIKVDVGTPQQTLANLGTAIRTIVEEPTKVSEMSRAALLFSETNTWENKVRKTYQLIEQSLEASQLD